MIKKIHINIATSIARNLVWVIIFLFTTSKLFAQDSLTVVGGAVVYGVEQIHVSKKSVPAIAPVKKKKVVTMRPSKPVAQKEFFAAKKVVKIPKFKPRDIHFADTRETENKISTENHLRNSSTVVSSSAFAEVKAEASLTLVRVHYNIPKTVLPDNPYFNVCFTKNRNKAPPKSIVF